jgi:hypothetical protein
MSKSRKMISVVAIAIGLLLVTGASGISCCNCLSWNPVTVSWTGSSPGTWNGNCGGSVAIPWITLGTAVSINSSINCSQSCQRSYSWSITTSGTTPQITWTGIGLPASFAPTSAGCFEVNLNASCGSNKCRPCQLKICIEKIQPPPCCECLDWEPVTVTWSGSSPGTWTGKCGDNLPISAASLCKAVSITSSINCSDNCQPTYTWSVTKSPGTPPAEGPWTGTGLPASFSPTSPGSFTVVLNASCDGISCPPCNIFIRVSTILPRSFTNTYSACVCDNFTAPTESPTPSNALLNWINTNYGGTNGSRNCDDKNTADQYWAHTFSNLGSPAGYQIQSAKLTIGVHNGDTNNENDTLALGFISANNSPWSWSNHLGPPIAPNFGIVTGNDGTITLDLGVLPPPPPSSILGLLANNGFLDVVVQDDSGVDCATLEVTYICSP